MATKEVKDATPVDEVDAKTKDSKKIVLPNGMDPSSLLQFALPVLLGFIISICVVMFSKYKIQYLADPSFAVHKCALIMAFLSISYASTFFLRHIWKSEKWILTEGFSTAIWYLTIVWLSFAVALIPFNHTIIKNKATGEMDIDAMDTLKTFYQITYNIPIAIAIIILVFGICSYLINYADTTGLFTKFSEMLPIYTSRPLMILNDLFKFIQTTSFETVVATPPSV